MTPKKILLATDLSCRCDRAMDRAVALATEWQAQLVVLHVLQEPAPVTDLPSWRRRPIHVRWPGGGCATTCTVRRALTSR
jgi:hypothetical protein